MSPQTSENAATARPDRAVMWLVAIVALQALCALVFVGDVIFDLIYPEPGEEDPLAFEALVSAGLAIGVGFGAWELRRNLRRTQAAEAALSAAQGAFGAFVDRRFEDWSLTPAEREVALFTLKGFDAAEIAKLRGAAQGTVRAQLAKIYAKSGVANRGQLVSVFIDELLAGPVAPMRAG